MHKSYSFLCMSMDKHITKMFTKIYMLLSVILRIGLKKLTLLSDCLILHLLFVEYLVIRPC